MDNVYSTNKMYPLTSEIATKLPPLVIDLANQLYFYLFDDGELPDIPETMLYEVFYALWIAIDYNTIFNPKRQIPLKYLEAFLKQGSAFFDPEIELALALCSPIYAERLRSKIRHDRFRTVKDPLALKEHEKEEDKETKGNKGNGENQEENEEETRRYNMNMSRFANPVAAIKRIAPPFLHYLVGWRTSDSYPESDLYPYLSSPYFSLVSGIIKDTSKPFRVEKAKLLRRLNAFVFPLIKRHRNGKILAGCVLAGGFLFMLSNDNLYYDYRSFRSSDVDLFVYGRPEHRDKVLKKVLDFYAPYPKTYSSSLINIDVPSHDEHGDYTRRVQIILSPALHPMDVINTFDLSHIQLAYDGDLYTTTVSSFFAMYGESKVVIDQVRGSRIRKAALKGVSVVNSNMRTKVDGYELQTPYVMIEGTIYHKGKLMDSISRIPLATISEEEFWQHHYYIPFVISVPYDSLRVEELPASGELERDVLYVVKAGTRELIPERNVFGEMSVEISGINVRFSLKGGLRFEYSENWRHTEVLELWHVHNDEDLLLFIDRYDLGHVVGVVSNSSV